MHIFLGVLGAALALMAGVGLATLVVFLVRLPYRAACFTVRTIRAVDARNKTATPTTPTTPAPGVLTGSALREQMLREQAASRAAKSAAADAAQSPEGVRD